MKLIKIYMFKKILPVLVLLASIGQVVAGATIAIGAFTGDSYGGLFTYTQPAPFIFSIWGVIYVLAIVYGVYQVIPKNNNSYLEHNRPYALVAFVGSGVWLYFAGTGDAPKWITVPILIAVAYALYKAVTPKTEEKLGVWESIASHKALFPYAAWTAIAMFVNIHTIVLQYGLISSTTANLALGLVLWVGIICVHSEILKRLGTSIWFGAVGIWALFGIVVANLTDPQGSMIVVVFSSLAFLYFVYLQLKRVHNK